MSSAALITTARESEQLRCPSMDEQKMEVWSTHTMEFYSVMKKKEIMELAGKWMELDGMVLTEATQALKDQHCMCSLVCGPSSKLLYMCIHVETSAGRGTRKQSMRWGEMDFWEQGNGRRLI